jgi:Fe-S oxidoreductase
MENLDLAAREIMWNIPKSFTITMYVLFVVSSVVCLMGFYKKYQFVVGTGSLKDLLPEKLNWSRFFHTIFLTGKVKRDGAVGFFHGLIYYGFIILWIATDLVAIHYDTPFKVFQGWTYKIISLLADVAGVAIIVGLGLARFRRYVKKPDYLAATKPNNEKFMYAIIGLLVLIGFFIEGIRIMATGMPIIEQTWAPIGWFMANLFLKLPVNEGTWSMIHKGLWLFHMANTFVFIAAIGHTKFFHIIALPLNALLTPAKRGGVLNLMDFENEDAETFGLGKISELTAKNRMDLLACVECGRCTNVCPSLDAGKNLNPKTIVTKMRDLVENSTNPDANIWEENPIYEFNEIDACTTCGACMEECPANIEHVQLIMEAKRYKALTLGEIPPAAGDAVNKIKNNGNPWGISQDDRFNWAEGLEVPVIEKSKKVDYLYYVGCAGSYDGANQEVVKSTVKLLKSAGVDFAVLGKTEKCNGDPIRRFGDEYSFFEVAIENIATLNEYDFGKVVTHCPHCLHTIGKEYAKFEDGDFEVVHHTELLAELIKAGKITPKKEVSEELTFHDPCYLGRHHGEYNAPRSILESIPGLQIKEMEKNKDAAQCCGMGGGNMWYELPEGEHLAKKRLEQIDEVSVPKLSTACSFCLINFNSSKSQVKGTEEIDIEDVAQTLAKSVFE